MSKLRVRCAALNVVTAAELGRADQCRCVAVALVEALPVCRSHEQMLRRAPSTYERHGLDRTGLAFPVAPPDKRAAYLVWNKDHWE